MLISAAFLSFAFSISTIKSTHHYKEESDAIIYTSTNGLDIDFTSSSISNNNSNDNGNRNGNDNRNGNNYITDPKVRSRAIQQAALQTATFLRKEDRYQQLRDKAKHEHVRQVQEQKEQKRIQEEEKEQVALEDKYYMYYEDTDDTAATVVGMTYSSDIKLYQRFIGSLRATGFGGQIILGIEETLSTTHPDIISYLQGKNVTLQYLHPIECTFSTAKSLQKCYKPYPHIKREWARFPLARDWLSACTTCNGPVIFAFPEQTFFQKNPFGIGMPVVKRLHLYEQHPSVDVSKTSAGILMKACVDIDLQKEMEEGDPDIDSRGILSAATALGQRDDIIDYLGLVASIIREWMQKNECHFQHSSNDLGMAIVNFLRVKERLPYKTRIMVHRTGIVNNVDFEGMNAIEAHVHLWKFRGLTTEEADGMPYIDEGLESVVSNRGWIDTDYLVTDEEGHFIDVFLQTSAVIYGYSSFGKPFLNWLDRHLNITDDVDGDGEEEALGGIVSESGIGIVDDSVAVSTPVVPDSEAVSTGSGRATNTYMAKILGVDPDALVPLPLPSEEDPTQKEKEGYYITQQEREHVTKSDVLVERKKEIRFGENNATPADTHTNAENNASKEGMYYSKPGVNAIDGDGDGSKNDVGKNYNDRDDEVDTPVAVVPVAETHAKEEGRDKTSEKEAEESVAANIQLEPVDVKIKIPNANQAHQDDDDNVQKVKKNG